MLILGLVVKIYAQPALVGRTPPPFDGEDAIRVATNVPRDL